MSLTRKAMLICLVVAVMFSMTLVKPARAEAFWGAVVSAVVSVGKWVVDYFADSAKETAKDVLDAARGVKTAMTLKDLIHSHDYVSALGMMGIMVLKWVSDLLKLVNDVVYGFIFGDLLMLIDYKKLPGAAGRHVNHLYTILTYVGEALAFFFFTISQGLILFKLSAKRAWKDLFIYIRRFAAVLILIPMFPYLFSLSLSLTAIVSDKIMSEKIQGEMIRHAPAGKTLEGSVSLTSPATGLDLLGNKIDYYLNLPETVVQEVASQGRQAVNTAITSVKDNFNQAVDNTVNKAVDDTVGKGIDAIADKFGIGVTTGSGGTSSGPVKTGIPTDLLYAVIGYIINAIIEITSLTMALTLLTLKGFQLAALLLLFIGAPLILAFMVLPTYENIGMKFFKAYFCLLGWNIIWALGVKIYGITGLIANTVNAGGSTDVLDLLGQGTLGVLPFAGCFMRIGILLVMIGASGWVGIIATAAIGSAAVSAGAGLVSLTSAAGMVGRAASIPSRITHAAQSAGAGAVQGFGKAVGAVGNPTGFVQQMTHGAAAATARLGNAYRSGVDKGSGASLRARMVEEKMFGQSGKTPTPEQKKQILAKSREMQDLGRIAKDLKQSETFRSATTRQDGPAAGKRRV